MAKSNKVICRYNQCRHESRQLDKEDAVVVGKMYFHKDCFKERKDKSDIVKLWLDNINPNTPVAQIRSVVNNIVNKKEIPSGQLLFGLQYYIDHKIRLNYPGGLYYVIANKDVEEEYKKQRNKGRKPNFSVVEDIQGFTYYQPKKKTLDNFME